VAVKAVFLDKDGTLIENVPYNVRPERIRLMSGASVALRRLANLGYLLIVVSNQPGVALGYFEATALRDVERRLRQLFATAGVPLAGFYYCPHHPKGSVARYAVRCTCRKPAPGLLLAAAAIHDIDLSDSWMIGDILDDVEAGARAGCRTVHVDVGNETEWRSGPFRQPHIVTSNLASAAQRIAEQVRPRRFSFHRWMEA
jgi:D-glycero-D-manno-heptose 1,7-bisphosphate phosphatase